MVIFNFKISGREDLISDEDDPMPEGSEVRIWCLSKYCPLNNNNKFTCFHIHFIIIPYTLGLINPWAAWTSKIILHSLLQVIPGLILRKNMIIKVNLERSSTLPISYQACFFIHIKPLIISNNVH